MKLAAISRWIAKHREPVGSLLGFLTLYVVV